MAEIEINAKIKPISKNRTCILPKIIALITPIGADGAYIPPIIPPIYGCMMAGCPVEKIQ